MKYLKKFKPFDNGIGNVAVVHDPASASPMTLMMSSGGELARTDKKNFEPNGQYNSFDDVLPPRSAMSVPRYVAYMSNVLKLNKEQIEVVEKQAAASPVVETPKTE